MTSPTSPTSTTSTESTTAILDALNHFGLESKRADFDHIFGLYGFHVWFKFRQYGNDPLFLWARLDPENRAKLAAHLNSNI